MVMRSDFWIACFASLVLAVSPAWIVGNVLNPTASHGANLPKISELALVGDIPAAAARFTFGSAAQIWSATTPHEPTEYLAMLHQPAGIAALPLFSLQPPEIRRSVANALGLIPRPVRPATTSERSLDQVRDLTFVSGEGADALRQSMAAVSRARTADVVGYAKSAPAALLATRTAPLLNRQDVSPVLQEARAPEIELADSTRLALAVPAASFAAERLAAAPASIPGEVTTSAVAIGSVQPTAELVAAPQSSDDLADIRPPGLSLLGAGRRDETAAEAVAAPVETEVLPWLRPKLVKSQTRVMRDDVNIDENGNLQHSRGSETKARARQKTAQLSTNIAGSKGAVKPVRHTWRLASGIRFYHMQTMYETCGTKELQCNTGRTVCKC